MNKPNPTCKHGTDIYLYDCMECEKEMFLAEQKAKAKQLAQSIDAVRYAEEINKDSKDD